MSLISTTVNSRRASTIPEAKTKKRVYEIVDKLEAAEKFLIESAKTHDESDKDFAKGEKDMVILTEDLYERDGSFLANVSKDGHILSHDNSGSYYHHAASLQIEKKNDTTVYRYKGGRNYDLPASNLKLIKTEKEGKDPEYTLIEGRLSLMMHSLGSGIGGALGKITNLRIRVGE